MICRIVSFDICDGFVYFDEGKQNQPDDKEENQRENGRAQTSKYLIGETENKRSDPGGAAFADLVEGVVFSFFTFRNHFGEEAAADGLRAAHDKGDEDAENEELGNACFTVETEVSVDDHA